MLRKIGIKDFSRAVEPDKAEARLENGLLEVREAKAHEESRRKTQKPSRRPIAPPERVATI